MKKYLLIMIIADILSALLLIFVILFFGNQRKIDSYSKYVWCKDYSSLSKTGDGYDTGDIDKKNALEITNLLKANNKKTIRVAITDKQDKYFHKNPKFVSDTMIYNNDGKEIGYSFFPSIGISNVSINSKTGIKISDVHNDTYTYKGEICIYSTKSGFIIINKLDIEEYIMGVVASEMPDSFNLEAKKAQAICARSYLLANQKTEKINGIKFDVDDTTRYQVFGRQNYSRNTKESVEKTKGVVLMKNGKIINATFFSTSCGYTTDSSVWGDNKKIIRGNFIGSNVNNSIEVSSNDYFRKYLNSDIEAYEKECVYYRWNTNIDKNTIKNNLASINVNVGEISNVKITDRGTGGIVKKMEVIGKNKTYISENQYEIRQILAPQNNVITLNNGEKKEGGSLLPSAFIAIEKRNDTYYIIGGGYGHGVGMSQYGAQKMAEDGKSYKEILKIFYH